MHLADWIVLSLYLAATVGIGVLLGRLVKTPADLFAAGGRSPWWASGLSAFMTMFSANTFVVWGGMAYEHGTHWTSLACPPS
jgi:SSS family solute:Na+ symporter